MGDTTVMLPPRQSSSGLRRDEALERTRDRLPPSVFDSIKRGLGIRQAVVEAEIAELKRNLDLYAGKSEQPAMQSIHRGDALVLTLQESASNLKDPNMYLRMASDVEQALQAAKSLGLTGVTVDLTAATQCSGAAVRKLLCELMRVSVPVTIVGATSENGVLYSIRLLGLHKFFSIQ